MDKQLDLKEVADNKMRTENIANLNKAIKKAKIADNELIKTLKDALADSKEELQSLAESFSFNVKDINGDSVFKAKTDKNIRLFETPINHLSIKEIYYSLIDEQFFYYEKDNKKVLLSDDELINILQLKNNFENAMLIANPNALMSHSISLYNEHTGKINNLINKVTTNY